jgi:hypothetical protein
MTNTSLQANIYARVRDYGLNNISLYISFNIKNIKEQFEINSIL